ncbi:hypothetical protein BJ912DRAFT_279864 [Pholiota molesta]|nr:hypothetical protein BJ912DRAFT_279864 [Pholiota molesta]
MNVIRLPPSNPLEHSESSPPLSPSSVPYSRKSRPSSMVQAVSRHPLKSWMFSRLSESRRRIHGAMRTLSRITTAILRLLMTTKTLWAIRRKQSALNKRSGGAPSWPEARRAGGGTGLLLLYSAAPPMLVLRTNVTSTKTDSSQREEGGTPSTTSVHQTPYIL